jgi:hypothetical protein
MSYTYTPSIIQNGGPFFLTVAAANSEALKAVEQTRHYASVVPHWQLSTCKNFHDTRLHPHTFLAKPHTNIVVLCVCDSGPANCPFQLLDVHTGSTSHSLTTHKVGAKRLCLCAPPTHFAFDLVSRCGKLEKSKVLRDERSSKMWAHYRLEFDS